jgi:hypothetical protein
VIPKGQVHSYKFLADGQPMLDPVNPQRTVLDNGMEWSRFFTEQCSVPISLESRELAILIRLTNEVLPFTVGDAKRFMHLYYFLPPTNRPARRRFARRFDWSSRSASSTS